MIGAGKYVGEAATLAEILIQKHHFLAEKKCVNIFL